MASKKPASKTRKPSKPAATRSPAHKSAAHRAVATRSPASTQRAAGSRARPALPAKATPKGKVPVSKGPPPKAAPALKPVAAAKPAIKSTVSVPAASAPTPAPAAPARPPRPGVIAVGVPSRSGPRPTAELEEGEGAEPGSLLAGPRNVKPYIAKRGELYMSKEQLGHFQHILGSWKRDLMEEVDRTVTHMKDEAANFPDPNDRATQEEEFSLELRTRDRERKLIRKIEEALKRIEDGSYGYCLETGEEIGIKRLEARPVATLSIEAQERRERRERQYGDRDDRYR